MKLLFLIYYQNNDTFNIQCFTKLSKVEGDPKATFSIATTRCGREHHSFLWIALLYLDLYLIMLNVKQGGIKYSLSLWYDSTWDWNPVPRTIGEHSTHYTNGPV